MKISRNRALLFRLTCVTMLLVSSVLIQHVTPVRATEPLAIPPADPVAKPPATPLATLPADPVAKPPAAPLATPPVDPVAKPPAAPLATPPADPVATPPAAPLATPPAAPLATPPADPVAKPPAAPLATPPADQSKVQSDTLNDLMAEIEFLSTKSTGNASCSFKFLPGKNSVTLNLTTHNSQLQTVEMPGTLRFRDEGSAGDRTIFIQGKKYFACGSYPGRTARELVEKLRELNELLSQTMKKKPHP